jgi:hypothetical protein
VDAAYIPNKEERLQALLENLQKESMTVEQREWLKMSDACFLDGNCDLEALSNLPASPFPPPLWINECGPGADSQCGRQNFHHRSPLFSIESTVVLVVIPHSRERVASVEELEEWMMYWKEPYVGAMRDVSRAYGSLCLERSVRTNVTRKTFLAWRLENPRYFITERELRYWRRAGRLRKATKESAP